MDRASGESWRLCRFVTAHPIPIRDLWRFPTDSADARRKIMYRVYSGPPGSESLSPLEKERMLFKEFALLDDAFAWADHLRRNGRVALLIEGDDGTHLSKREIADYITVRPDLGPTNNVA